MNDVRVSRDEDARLDETIAGTFPASDAPAGTVVTGIRVDGSDPVPPLVTDRADRERFEVVIDGHIAFLEYERRPGALALIHTEVPDDLRGRGVGAALAEAGIAAARAEGRRVVAICPFVRTYLRTRDGGPELAGA